MMPSADAKPSRHPRMASRTLSGEAVLVDPERNVVRMLNPVGSRIWELADGTRSLEQIADVLVLEFDVTATQAQQSVVAFVDELAAKELLIWVT